MKIPPLNVLLLQRPWSGILEDENPLPFPLPGIHSAISHDCGSGPEGSLGQLSQKHSVFTHYACHQKVVSDHDMGLVCLFKMSRCRMRRVIQQGDRRRASIGRGILSNGAKSVCRSGQSFLDKRNTRSTRCKSPRCQICLVFRSTERLR